MGLQLRPSESLSKQFLIVGQNKERNILRVRSSEAGVLSSETKPTKKNYPRNGFSLFRSNRFWIGTPLRYGAGAIPASIASEKNIQIVGRSKGRSIPREIS